MKCRRCKGAAVIDVRRHNAAFCADCFVHHCREQVRRAVDEYEMIPEGSRVLVAVSGGKDSLMLWEVLADLGHDVDGVHLGLGIGEYSRGSLEHSRRFARSLGRTLVEVDLPGDHGYDVPTGSRAAGRSPCSACGLSKRHLFNAAARDGGYDVLATGHNLDDEAAVLFGNVMRWDEGFLGRQFPVLPASEGFVRKVKPMVRLGERETAAYCVVRGIDYVVDECPMAGGNRHLLYKELLNELEQRSPGTKAAFVLGFFQQAHERFAGASEEERTGLGPCSECGSPTPTGVCAFCRLKRRAIPAPHAVADGG